MNYKKLKIVVILSVIILVSPVSFFSSATGLFNNEFETSLTKMGNDVYVEDFSNTLFKDLAPTTAFGWGQGAISNQRNLTMNPMDYFPTPAPIRDIDIDGRHLYAAYYEPTTGFTQIAVYDINDPYNLAQVGTSTDHSHTMALDADGGILYAGHDSIVQDAIFAYNISNPTNPSWVWGRGMDNFVTDIEIEGHLVYYTSYNRTKSFRLIYAPDLTLPNSKQINTNWDSTQALGLTIDGHFAYIAASTDGFYVLNVSSKYAPAELSHIDTPGNATDVIIDGHLAYLADGEAGVHIIDISDPYTPNILGTYDTPGYAGKLVKQGRTVFVADRSGGIIVLDVADPFNPVHVYTILYDNVWDVDLFGGIIFAGTNIGIYSFTLQAGDDITYYNSANFLTVWDNFLVYDMRIQGDIAYIAGGVDGFYTLNVRNPEAPVLLDHLIMPGRDFRKIDVNGQFAYLVDNVYFSVFKIADPTNIQLLSELTSVGGLTDVFLQGQITFLSWGGGTIPVLNATFPDGLSWSDMLDEPFLPSNVSSIWAQGRHVYSVNSDFGASSPAIYIHSTTDLTNLVQKDMYIGSTWMSDIYVDGDIAYLANKYYTILIDVTDSHNIVVTDSTFSPSANALGIWGFGQYFMTADYNNGVRLYNAINPYDILEVGQIPQIKHARQVTTHGDYTYVANETSLSILRHFESGADTYVAGTSVAQSKEIDSIEGQIKSATLDVVDFVPPGTNIDYYMSADGGTNWELATPGILHEFTNFGDDLRWRAEFFGPTYSGAHVYEININYEFNEVPTIPTIANIEDKTFGMFKVDWDDSTDDVAVDHYTLQMSDTLSFIDIQKEWTTTKSQQSVTLAKGTYYFRVQAVDDEGLPSPWSLVEIANVNVAGAMLFVIIGGGALVLIAAIVIPLVLIMRRKKKGKIPTR